MDDRRWLAWIGQGVDLCETPLVPAADPFVLAEMVIPRAHGELLEYASRIRGVDP